MKFENTQVFGFENAIIGARLPMCKNFEDAKSKCDSDFQNNIIGENDLSLLKRLIKADDIESGYGTPNSKFLQMIEVWVSIEAPLAFWKEADTYRHAVKNSTSTMHRIQSYPIDDSCFEKKPNGKISKLIHLDELEKARQLYNETKDKDVWYDLIYGLGDSWLQTRMFHCNYATLRNMAFWRRNHKQNSWSGKDNPQMKNFIDWARSLPYAQELIFIDEVEE